MVCGYDRCTTSLHFHHVDPTTKAFNVQMGMGKALAVYRAEAGKCVLVCANCHGEIEAGLIPCPPLSSRSQALDVLAPRYPQSDSNRRSPP